MGQLASKCGGKGLAQGNAPGAGSRKASAAAATTSAAGGGTGTGAASAQQSAEVLASSTAAKQQAAAAAKEKQWWEPPKVAEGAPTTPSGHALPDPLHATLPLSALKPGQIVVVGDVHGCAGELARLLGVSTSIGGGSGGGDVGVGGGGGAPATTTGSSSSGTNDGDAPPGGTENPGKRGTTAAAAATASSSSGGGGGCVGFDPEVDNLFLVGDLVNKGPASAEVLALARRLGAHVVRGNHDEAALTAYGKLRRGEKVKPKFEWVEALGPEDCRYLASLPFSIAVPELRLLLVHAGLVPGVGLREQRLHDLFKMRDVFPSAEGKGGWAASEEKVGGGRAWAKEYDGPYHCFFGHDAKRKLQLRKAATGLDTGCVYGGQLSAAVLPPRDELLARVRAACGPTDAANADPEADAAANAAKVGAQLKGRAPTFVELGAEIVSVPAARVYEDKKAKKEAEKRGNGEEDADVEASTSAASGSAAAGDENAPGSSGNSGRVAAAGAPTPKPAGGKVVSKGGPAAPTAATIRGGSVAGGRGGGAAAQKKKKRQQQQQQPSGGGGGGGVSAGKSKA